MIKAAVVPHIFLSFILLFLSGCVYLTHFDDVMFLKGLEDNQKQMQAQLDKEEKLYDKLGADIHNGNLKTLTSKYEIVKVYGEPTLCKPAEGQTGIKETCVYRKQAGGLLTEIISLNLDGQGKLYSWKISDRGK